MAIPFSRARLALGQASTRPARWPNRYNKSPSSNQTRERSGLELAAASHAAKAVSKCSGSRVGGAEKRFEKLPIPRWQFGAGCPGPAQPGHPVGVPIAGSCFGEPQAGKGKAGVCPKRGHEQVSGLADGALSQGGLAPEVVLESRQRRGRQGREPLRGFIRLDAQQQCGNSIE